MFDNLEVTVDSLCPAGTSRVIFYNNDGEICLVHYYEFGGPMKAHGLIAGTESTRESLEYVRSIILELRRRQDDIESKVELFKEIIQEIKENRIMAPLV